MLDLDSFHCVNHLGPEVTKASLESTCRFIKWLRSAYNFSCYFTFIAWTMFPVVSSPKGLRNVPTSLVIDCGILSSRNKNWKFFAAFYSVVLRRKRRHHDESSASGVPICYQLFSYGPSRLLHRIIVDFRDFDVFRLDEPHPSHRYPSDLSTVPRSEQIRAHWQYARSDVTAVVRHRPSKVTQVRTIGKNSWSG